MEWRLAVWLESYLALVVSHLNRGAGVTSAVLRWWLERERERQRDRRKKNTVRVALRCASCRARLLWWAWLKSARVYVPPLRNGTGTRYLLYNIIWRAFHCTRPCGRGLRTFAHQ